MLHLVITAPMVAVCEAGCSGGPGIDPTGSAEPING